MPLYIGGILVLCFIFIHMPLIVDVKVCVLSWVGIMSFKALCFPVLLHLTWLCENSSCLY